MPARELTTPPVTYEQFPSIEANEDNNWEPPISIIPNFAEKVTDLEHENSDDSALEYVDDPELHANQSLSASVLEPTAETIRHSTPQIDAVADQEVSEQGTFLVDKFYLFVD